MLNSGLVTKQDWVAIFFRKTAQEKRVIVFQFELVFLGDLKDGKTKLKIQLPKG